MRAWEKLDFNFTTLFWVMGANLLLVVDRILISAGANRWVILCDLVCAGVMLVYGMARLIYIALDKSA